MMVGNNSSSKKIINLIFFVFILALFSNRLVFCQIWPLPKAVAKASQSVVQIVTYDKKGEMLWTGNGFFIAPGKILTCAHVIEDAYSAQILLSLKVTNQVNRNSNQVKILKMDVDRDLALLKVNDCGEKYLELEKEQELIRNQFVVAINHCLWKRKSSALFGFVHTKIYENGTREIISSVPLVHGWSGGPLLNMKGYVIGMNRSMLGEGPKIGLSLDIGTIKEFLSRPDNPKDLAYAGSSVLSSVILAALGKFFGGILEWIVYHTSGIVEFLFFHGVSRGIYILILTGLLISWRSQFLFRSLRAWKRRNAVDKIIKWSNAISTLEMVPVLETNGSTEKNNYLFWFR